MELFKSIAYFILAVGFAIFWGYLIWLWIREVDTPPQMKLGKFLGDETPVPFS